MEGDNIMQVQNQIKQNSDDLQKSLLDLELWEKEMKKKEEEFKLRTPTSGEQEIPPIRNLQYRAKKKRNHKKSKDKIGTSNKAEICENGGENTKQAEEPTKEDNNEIPQADESGENNSEQEEFEVIRNKQLACLHKEKGNEFFKKGNFDSAINSYTTGIMLDPENPLLFANRAMAFLKKEQFQAAENDCTDSLSYDPTYTKAYLRRGTARRSLDKNSLAKEDFEKVLELESDNKLAQTELKRLEKILTENSNGTGISTKSKTELSEIKTVKYSAKKLEVSKSTTDSKVDNFCIFEDSKEVAITPSTKFKSNLTKKELRTTQLDEKVFVKKVEDTLNSIKSKPSSIETEISDLSINLEIPLPPVPSTSFQFVADWNEISQNPKLRYQYLKQFPPEKLPIIFKHYMEPLVFPTLLETLSTSFIEYGDDVFDYMKNLADIGRFSTTLMFLSDKEEEDLQKLLECVKSSNRPETEISNVLIKYKR